MSWTNATAKKNSDNNINRSNIINNNNNNNNIETTNDKIIKVALVGSEKCKQTILKSVEPFVKESIKFIFYDDQDKQLYNGSGSSGSGGSVEDGKETNTTYLNLVIVDLKDEYERSLDLLKYNFEQFGIDILEFRISLSPFLVTMSTKLNPNVFSSLIQNGISYIDWDNCDGNEFCDSLFTIYNEKTRLELIKGTIIGNKMGDVNELDRLISLNPMHKDDLLTFHRMGHKVVFDSLLQRNSKALKVTGVMALLGYLISTGENLSLVRCNLTRVPTSLFQYSNSSKHLVSLDLSDNCIKELPKEIQSMNLLKNLYLDSNKLDDLPLELSNLSQLKKISIRNNPLSNLPNKFEKKSSKEILQYLKDELVKRNVNVTNNNNLK